MSTTTSPTVTLSYPISSTIKSTTVVTDTFETNIIDTIILQKTPPPSLPTSLDDPSIPGKTSSASIRENDRIPIIIVISFLVILFLTALLFVYIHGKRKKRQQKALATAIIDAETGEISMSDSPSPPPPPTPPPTPLPHAFLRDDEISQHSSITIEPARPLPRYKISTLQIEPMTKRLTMNLGQKGKKIINVVSLRDGDDYDFHGSSDDESGNKSGSKGEKGNKRFSVRKNFWK
ncbi:11940_t:CDS:2 [Funneliformis caledonium]|uniref:11940_t:CDS:1 n=1 Tax=Funneliformis caledonium TaxID=1117310 RepID=A0A9N8ZAT5_9GLOM|nr:11940_t:CDS:2 [Funneliformis caledonium]